MLQFSKNLRHFRELRGFSKTYMAKQIGVKLSSYLPYETGAREPTLTNLQVLAGALNVTVDELLNDDFKKCVDFWQKKYHKITLNADESVIMTLPIADTNKTEFRDNQFVVDGFYKNIYFENKNAFIDFTKNAKNIFYNKLASYYSDFTYNSYKKLKAGELVAGAKATVTPFQKVFVQGQQTEINPNSNEPTAAIVLK